MRSDRPLTREERRRRRRGILTGIAWLLSCVTVFCAAHYIADHLIVDAPMGIYAEEGKTDFDLKEETA